MQTTYVTLDSLTPHLYYLFELDKFTLLNWLNRPVVVEQGMHDRD